MKELDIKIFRNLTRKKFEEYIAFLQQQGQPLPDCEDSTDIRFKIYGYRTKCVGYCYTQDPIDSTYDDIDILVQVKNCTEDPYCCKITESFCVDDFGVIHQEETMESDAWYNCSGLSLDPARCEPGQNVDATECHDFCIEY
ncbi:MAG: hypothetical protein ACLFQX_03020 [Candidatus Kapaibacterium sp.]